MALAEEREENLTAISIEMIWIIDMVILPSPEHTALPKRELPPFQNN